jgi:hypothetical protein
MTTKGTVSLGIWKEMGNGMPPVFFSAEEVFRKYMGVWANQSMAVAWHSWQEMVLSVHIALLDRCLQYWERCTVGMKWAVWRAWRAHVETANRAMLDKTLKRWAHRLTSGAFEQWGRVVWQLQEIEGYCRAVETLARFVCKCGSLAVRMLLHGGFCKWKYAMHCQQAYEVHAKMERTRRSLLQTCSSETLFGAPLPMMPLPHPLLTNVQHGLERQEEDESGKEAAGLDVESRRTRSLEHEVARLEKANRQLAHGLDDAHDGDVLLREAPHLLISRTAASASCTSKELVSELVRSRQISLGSSYSGYSGYNNGQGPLHILPPEGVVLQVEDGAFELEPYG